VFEPALVFDFFLRRGRSSSSRRGDFFASSVDCLTPPRDSLRAAVAAAGAWTSAGSAAPVTGVVAPHCGHRTFLPAAESETRNAVSHFEQITLIAMIVFHLAASFNPKV
jgi:hypothetical protein